MRVERKKHQTLKFLIYRLWTECNRIELVFEKSESDVGHFPLLLYRRRWWCDRRDTMTFSSVRAQTRIKWLEEKPRRGKTAGSHGPIPKQSKGIFLRSSSNERKNEKKQNKQTKWNTHAFKCSVGGLFCCEPRHGRQLWAIVSVIVIDNQSEIGYAETDRFCSSSSLHHVNAFFLLPRKELFKRLIVYHISIINNSSLLSSHTT